MHVGRPLLWAPLLSACRGLRALPKSFFFVYCFGLMPVIFQSLYGSVRVDLPLLNRGMFSICDPVTYKSPFGPQLNVSGQSKRLSVMTGSIFFDAAFQRTTPLCSRSVRHCGT